LGQRGCAGGAGAGGEILRPRIHSRAVGREAGERARRPVGAGPRRRARWTGRGAYLAGLIELLFPPSLLAGREVGRHGRCVGAFPPRARFCESAVTRERPIYSEAARRFDRSVGVGTAGA
jgi:hypothetical protein